MDALRQLSLIFDLDPSCAAALSRYLDLLFGWRGGNLTGVRDREEAACRLIGDALAVLDVTEAREALESKDAPAVDLGAGAGVPGLPLAMAVPAARLVALESVGKKCAFLRAAVADLGLGRRVAVVCARSEEHAAVGAPGREAYGLALARAVGPLPTVVELAAPLLTEGAALLVPTTAERAGQEWAAGEAAARRCSLAMERIEPLTRSPLTHSVCVVMRKVAPTPDWLPRRPGRARTHPLVTKSRGRCAWPHAA
jgi:16S rRNA (guanine527-N7)-methyltransferase